MLLFERPEMVEMLDIYGQPEATLDVTVQCFWLH
jgi:hypothetical protein